MNTPKKTLVAELTAALGPVIHAHSGATEALPKPVEKAIDQLADAVLRWRGRQEAATGSQLNKRTSSDSDELARLMSYHLADDAQPTAPVTTLEPTATRPRRPRI